MPGWSPYVVHKIFGRNAHTSGFWIRTLSPLGDILGVWIGILSILFPVLYFLLMLDFDIGFEDLGANDCGSEKAVCKLRIYDLHVGILNSRE